LIEVKNLTKIYGKKAAVDDISFTVNDGEIVGFLGPNGAGKTTTMNIMTGYISSTAGSVIINGFDILKEPEKAKKQIGYLPDTPPLYGDMRVCEYLDFVCDIKSVPKNKRKDMLDEICSTVKITDVNNRIIKNLSKGYRQRVGLAQALIGFPDVIILDEPTVGLDPKQIIEMRDVIKNLGERHTVILSSHILHEVSAVCDRIIIINDGKIIVQRKTDEFEGLSDGFFNIRFKANRSVDDILNIFGDFSPSFDGVKENGSLDFSLCLKNENCDLRERVFNIAANENIPILMFKPVTFSLEEIFIKVINNEYNINKDSDNAIESSEDNLDANPIEGNSDNIVENSSEDNADSSYDESAGKEEQ